MVGEAGLGLGTEELPPRPHTVKMPPCTPNDVPGSAPSFRDFASRLELLLPPWIRLRNFTVFVVNTDEISEEEAIQKEYFKPELVMRKLRW